MYCGKGQGQGNEQGETAAPAVIPPPRVKAHTALPVIEVLVGGRAVRALVDTGCTTTLVRSSLVGDRVGESWMSAFDGRKVRCGGERPVNLEVGGTPVEVSAVAIEHLVGDLDVLLGMDVIEQLGGVTVRSNGVDFEVGQCLMPQNEGCRAVSEREGSGGPQQIEDPAGALQGDDGEATEICTI